MGLTEDMVRPYAESETPKMFRGLDSYGLVQLLIQNVSYTPRKLTDIIAAQITHLGYISVKDDRYSGMAAVLSVDTKYSPKVKMYSLKNGTILDCKIDKRTFNKNKLNNGDIVIVMGTKRKPKMRKNADGKWETIAGTSELWITNYRKSNI
jgi:DNA polymerase-3 subunit alpha